jgi:hypothetical protein
MPGVRPACVANRWGQGTCSSERKTEVAKEMEAKLAALKAEREKQDQQLVSIPLKSPK